MKKYWLVGAVLCGLLSFSFLTASVSACIGPDGNPVEGTDGAKTNCITVSEEEEPIETTGAEWSVDPSSLNFGMLSEVGRSYTNTFKIINNTEQELGFTVAAAKYEGDVADENKLASGWIAFVGGVTYYKVPANGEKVVNVRVIVPADAQSGSQYAQIKVSKEDSEEYELVDVRMTIGGDEAKFGGGLGMSFISPIGISDKVSAKAVVKNDGNSGFEASYVLRGKSAFGIAEWTTLVEESAEVAPGKEATFENSGDALGYGIFSVEQVVTYVNDKGEMVSATNSRTVVNIPLWLVIVVVVVIVLIIALIIFLAIRSKKKEEAEEEAKEAAKARASKKNNDVDIEIDETE